MKTKIILFSILIAAIACMLLGISTYLRNNDIIKTAQEDDRKKQTEYSRKILNDAEEDINSFLKSYIEIAQNLEKDMTDKEPVIDFETKSISGEENRINTTLYGLFEKTYEAHQDFIDYIFWMDKDNRVLMSYPIYVDGVFALSEVNAEKKEGYFFDFTLRNKIEIEKTKLDISDKDSDNLSYTAKIYYPTHFEEPFKSNFIMMAVRLDGLKDQLRIPKEQGLKSEIYITDENGIILLHKDSDNNFDRKKLLTMAESSATKEEMFSEEVDLKYLNWKLGFIRELSQDFKDSTNSMKKDFSMWLLIFVILSIIASIPFGYFISRGIIRPIRKLSEGAVAIAGGNYGYQVTVKSRDEIGELARSFNTMSSQLKENIEKMEDELKDAHDLQMSLVPESSPEITGIQLSGLLIPAREVGGDYYDFVVQNNNLNIIVADSSGKVFAGAFSIMSTRGIVRNCISSDVDKPTNTLLSEIEKGVFLLGMKEQVTMVIARYDPDNRCISLSNAGNPPPILYSQSKGECERIKIVGLALNSPLSPEERPRQYDERKIDLTAGDVMVFYSDGLIEESTKDDRYGYQRLMDVIKESYDLDADKIVKRIHQSLIEFSQKDKDYTDDVSIVVIKVLT